MRHNLPQRVSLICIMRDIHLISKLDDSAKSTLQRNLVNLEKYSKEQLVDILNERVAMAFEPDVVSEDVLNLTADLAKGENGNARFAIELLWRAGKYADAEDFEEVTPDCARKAVSSIIPMVAKSELANLGLHEKLFLLAAAEVFKETEKAYATLTEIEKFYGVVCEEYNQEPKTHTQLWNYIQVFDALGLLKTRVSGEGSRGRSTLIYLPAVSAIDLERELRLMLENRES
jgi:cell division control protein 6